MAPECIKTTKYATEKSDVWSYGVVLWEIFSMGKLRLQIAPQHQKLHVQYDAHNVLVLFFFENMFNFESINNCVHRTCFRMIYALFHTYYLYCLLRCFCMHTVSI